MRELPEPEGFSVDTMFTESRSTANNYSKGAMCPVSEWWDRDQVLAIQKQAYEDGLRDAVPDGYVLVQIQPTEAMLNPGPLPKNEAEKFAADMAAGYRKEIWASMLTASQKEQQ